MYRALVPIDGDEDRTRAQADAVTRLPSASTDVEATVLHVYDDGERPADPTALDAGEEFAENLENAGMSVSTETRTGDPAGEILSVADEIGADAIVLGGRKRSPLGSLLFGSVTQAVILDAARPVTVTGAEVKEDPSHRCASCGEAYYTAPESDIVSCRRCGGARVEPVERDQRDEASEQVEDETVVAGSTERSAE